MSQGRMFDEPLEIYWFVGDEVTSLKISPVFAWRVMDSLRRPPTFLASD